MENKHYTIMKFTYQVTTNFDTSISLFEDWQDAVSFVREKSRELNTLKSNFQIEKYNYEVR